MKTHGTIINLSSYLPYTFEFNPLEIESTKAINRYKAPNIGGSAKRSYFTGFDNEEIKFTLDIIKFNKETGVNPDVEYFSQLREPDAGLIGIAGSFFGNENFPPPMIAFGWGISMVPLVYKVLDVRIKKHNFGDNGIARQATVNISLELDTENVVNKTNQIAKKAAVYAASIGSISDEIKYLITGESKEYMTGI